VFAGAWLRRIVNDVLAGANDRGFSLERAGIKPNVAAESLNDQMLAAADLKRELFELYFLGR
jgi:hypothetical protein